MGGEPKFICDEQLGKLARWLRIIGLDAYYRNRLPDRELIEIAEKESRVILTRDTRLVKTLEQKGLPNLFLLENYPALQLREVVAHFSDSIRIRVFVRCTECNVPLEEVPAAAVEGQVPPFVFSHQKQFRRCPQCHKLFWRGTHRPQVDLQLHSVLGELYDKLKEEVWSDGNG